nr:GH32 C-terminal domain-containing protein [Mesoplasma melaleucae]
MDKSSIEIFINEGRYTLTTKIFLENHNKVTTDIEELEIYQLAKNNIKYNNIIFENNFIKW